MITSKLPLRSTTAFSQYNTIEALPHVYGLCTLQPIPYSVDGKFHLIADHSILAINAVRVSGKTIKSYQLHNTSDYTNHPISLLELLDSTESSNISMDVVGKLNNKGIVITNPADLIYDLLKLANVDIDYSRLLDFKYKTSGIELGGVINDDTSTARSIISEILSSIGAVWTLGSPQIATLYPSKNTTELTTEIPGRYINTLSSSISLDSIFTVLKYEFNQDFSSDKPKSTITMISENSQTYGNITKTIQAPYVRNTNSALLIATRLLQYYSVPVFKTQLEVDLDEEINPMEWISTTHFNLPASTDGKYFVTDSSSSMGSTTYDLKIESITSYTPSVELVGQSVLFEFTKSDLNYTYTDGILSLTIVNNETGTPIKNASVKILDQEKFSDTAGIVKFKIPSGTYSVKVSSPGFSSFTSEITI